MAMATKQIDFNGRVYSFNAGVNALDANAAIRDMFSLQSGRIVEITENGARILLDTEILSEVTGPLSFTGGQRAGMDRNKSPIYFLVPVTDPNETPDVFLCLSSYTGRRSPTSR